MVNRVIRKSPAFLIKSLPLYMKISKFYNENDLWYLENTVWMLQGLCPSLDKILYFKRSLSYRKYSLNVPRAMPLPQMFFSINCLVFLSKSCKSSTKILQSCTSLTLFLKSWKSCISLTLVYCELALNWSIRYYSISYILKLPINLPWIDISNVIVILNIMKLPIKLSWEFTWAMKNYR